MNMYRIGQGYDVHQLVESRKLILAGIEIPFQKGLKGHSDADVLLHAMIDALLGALALGDIGSFYPDTDPAFKNTSSVELLKDSYQMVQKLGWHIVNIDSTIIAEHPKLRPYIDTMCENIANILDLPLDRISIKAKTNEQLGYLGNQEAIEAQAVIMLKKADNV
ncbi:MAG: 2-C-methyl-D-erythritol 2,4-cyclodiphosphate synthase [Neisseriaceae bacterium]|nr:MAG: 2-C-methyl-D-erythritol 2,4-cyclodiphosphate synthase [Neisseriaceae bacterium]